MKKKVFQSILKGTCIVASCVLVVSCKQAPKMPSNNEYSVMTISFSDKDLVTSYSASIKGKQDVEVRPQVSGLITQVCIAEGASVHKGQTLFVIDQVPYKAAVETAKAAVESAEASLASAKLTADSKQELFNQKVVSNFDLQTAQNTYRASMANLQSAKANLTNAKNNLSYTEVKSPASGTAGMIPYRVGALVNASIATPLVTVSDDADMYVYFSMTENQILAISRQSGSLKNAMASMPAVDLKLSDGSMYNRKGRIDAISGIIDSKTGSVSVRATFPNPDKILRSGGSGNILFPFEKKGCIVIPQAATFEIQNKVFVYKVVDGKTQSTPITVFPNNDGKDYIVESGLKEGDVIISDGAGLLRDDMPVTPKQNNPQAATQPTQTK